MPGEFDLIARFVRAFRPPSSPRGPGDDCAVLPRLRGEECVTTDAVVEDVHFTRKTFSLEDVGHKALAVNLSDLASMGAAPRWFVCALALPTGTRAKHVDALARGMAPLARESGITLVGGNVTRARELSVTITAAGEVQTGRALLRSGASAGDVLYVSGTLGDARRGLFDLTHGIHRGPLAARQRRPSPRLALGLLSARHATAAVDISDGLAQDLGHLCRDSHVGARVDLEKLPISSALAAAVGERAYEWALAGGEDYELLLTVPASRTRAFERAVAGVGETVTRIGYLTTGRAIRFSRAGADVRATRGFDHFR